MQENKFNPFNFSISNIKKFIISNIILKIAILIFISNCSNNYENIYK